MRRCSSNPIPRSLFVALILALLTLMPSGIGSAQSLSFAVAEYPARSIPESVATDDFNGDGKSDLVAANYGSKNVSVLLGNGNGTFRPAVNYAVGSAPASVAVADLNGDAKPDLTVANFGSFNVSVLLGNGDGTFRGAVNFRTNAAGAPFSIVAADFNADGKLDVAAANATQCGGPCTFGTTVTVLLGNGDGTLRSPRQFAAGTSPFYLAVGDFNRDGNADLAVTNGADDLVVLLGNGNGAFQPGVTIAFADGSGPRGVAVGNLNGDGNPDIAVANRFTSNISVLRGNGDGTFLGPVNWPTTLSSQPVSVAIADLNLDGKPDLAVAMNFPDLTDFGEEGHVNVLLGNGNGTFGPPLNFYFTTTARKTADIVAGDFDGDGKPDLATANNQQNVEKLEGVGVLINTTAGPGPVTPASLTLNPRRVVGGNSSQGTVTLSGAAPSGGALVTLRSSNTAVATVPASVTVPKGAMGTTFTVKTKTVLATTSVTISASRGGVTRTATLTVRSQP